MLKLAYNAMQAIMKIFSYRIYAIEIYLGGKAHTLKYRQQALVLKQQEGDSSLLDIDNTKAEMSLTRIILLGICIYFQAANAVFILETIFQQHTL